jgi:hypothetical protein
VSQSGGRNWSSEVEISRTENRLKVTERVDRAQRMYFLYYIKLADRYPPLPENTVAPNRNSSNPTNLHHLYRLAPGESQKLDGGGGVRNRPGGPGWIPSSHRAIAAGSLLTPGDGLCVRSVAKPTEFVGTNSALLHWGQRLYGRSSPKLQLRQT